MGHTRGVRENIRAALAWADPRPRRVGRRGLFLAFLTVLDAAYGYALLAPPPGAPALAYPVVPPETWAIAWLTVAAVCASGILAPVARWQFVAAASLNTAWAARFAYLWYRHVPQAWIGMMVWLAFAFTVMVISGWPEPRPALPELLPLPPPDVPA